VLSVKLKNIPQKAGAISEARSEILGENYSWARLLVISLSIFSSFTIFASILFDKLSSSFMRFLSFLDDACFFNRLP
jgi:hypothetical protein